MKKISNWIKNHIIVSSLALTLFLVGAGSTGLIVNSSNQCNQIVNFLQNITIGKALYLDHSKVWDSELAPAPWSMGGALPQAIYVYTQDFTITPEFNGAIVTNYGATTNIVGTFQSVATLKASTPFSCTFINEVGAAPSGGTITTDGAYTIHTFTSSGTLVIPSSIVAEVLVVGGGGSAGRGTNASVPAGGGGGGGVQYDAAKPLSGTLIVTVGGGGASVIFDRTVGNTGGSSVFAGLTATGGLGGYSILNPLGAGGASGNPQGNAGGTKDTNQMGGGGGAGAAGGNGNQGTTTGGVGGVGLQYMGAYWAGGGGGAGATGGAGGNGGGGHANSTFGEGGAIAGADNTGGGGGGNYSSAAGSGAGGSGIVKVKYLTPAAFSAISIHPASTDKLSNTISTHSSVKSLFKGDLIKYLTASALYSLNVDSAYPVANWVDQLD